MAKRKVKKKDAPKEKNVGGAPTKLTEELIGHIANYIRMGNYVETAFGACGVPKACFYEWMAKGRLKGGTIYSALTDAVDRAVNEGEIRDIAVIERAANGIKAEYLKEVVEETDPVTNKTVKRERMVHDEEGKPILIRPAMKPDWRAAEWRLERRHPEKWGRSDKLHVESVLRPASASDEKVKVDAYNIKATLARIRSEY